VAATAWARDLALRRMFMPGRERFTFVTGLGFLRCRPTPLLGVSAYPRLSGTGESNRRPPVRYSRFARM
jgi:hypothetical protein